MRHALVPTECRHNNKVDALQECLRTPECYQFRCMDNNEQRRRNGGREFKSLLLARAPGLSCSEASCLGFLC